MVLQLQAVVGTGRGRGINPMKMAADVGFFCTKMSPPNPPRQEKLTLVTDLSPEVLRTLGLCPAGGGRGRSSEAASEEERFAATHPR